MRIINKSLWNMDITCSRSRVVPQQQTAGSKFDVNFLSLFRGCISKAVHAPQLLHLQIHEAEREIYRAVLFTQAVCVYSVNSRFRIISG